MQPANFRMEPGTPHPLGATWDGKGTNFAVFSAHATQIELCLFDSSGQHERARIALPEYTNQIWHGYVPGIAPGVPYGFRASGPYEPHNGYRFNPNKLLLDPYAVAMMGHLQWSPALFGYELESEDDTTFDTRDSAPFMPKCTVADRRFPWTTQPRHSVPWDQTVIYEMHVRGFTKTNPKIPPRLRGTYAGLGTPEALDYIKSIGVTSVELLPIHMYVNDQYLTDKGLRNYWGYNTINFFAPTPDYAKNPLDSLREFKEMVARLHDAGLEVILDVVYNHTAEGNERGPTLCYRGLDNVTYYRLQADNARYYVNDTGTGNTLDFTHPRVLQMVTDSLRYWVQETQVDGFRFDLGTILAREPDGFSSTSGFLKVCAQDPVLSTVKLIAEPWDCGPGGYQVGQFPPGWAEWNDSFRDKVRDFWRGEGTTGALAEALCASPGMFNQNGRRPWASVNFITAHDGFTLRDLVSYNDKHNEANGEDNNDGTSDNRSWNCGTEGPTTDSEIRTLRMRQMRNLLATLLLSQGTPMLVAGDEVARTQHGNNNAYCQDNEISWFKWEFDEEGSSLLKFVKELLSIRRSCKILRNGTFLTGEARSGVPVPDVMWVNTAGTPVEEAQWSDSGYRCFGMLVDTRAIEPNGESDSAVLLIFNSHFESVEFVLPERLGVDCWKRILSTADPAPDISGLRPGGRFTALERSFHVFAWGSCAHIAQ